MKFKSIFKTILLGAFFLSTLWLVVGIPQIFNSPDENANFLFANQVAKTGMPEIAESKNVDLYGVLGPRSMSAVGDKLVPNSFLGLPVTYGAFGRIFGSSIMLILTPLLAILAILAWRSSVFILFKNALLADLSAFFLMIHPAFWYYTGRTMMHNIAFLSFLIFGAWFVLKRSKPHLDFVFAGLCIGAALAFRTSEIIWVLPLCAILFYIARKHISWEQGILFFATVFLTLLPFAFFNNALYGSILTTGYQIDSSSIEFSQTQESSGEYLQDQQSFISRSFNLLLPFGFHEKAIVRHVWQYGLALYPWMSLLALIGMVLIFYRCKDISDRKLWKTLLALTLALSIWLGVFYGSWTFHDNPDPTIFSLGNSYVRYWLPLFLLSTPFAALVLHRLYIWMKKSTASKVAICFILIIFSALSVNLVFFGDDGFIHTRKALYSFEEKRSVILENTSEEAIVIVDRADKFVFPYRSVAQPLRSESTYQSMPGMLEQGALYYFGITFPEHDMTYLNDKKLKELGASIYPVVTIYDETLYRIVSTE